MSCIVFWVAYLIVGFIIATTNVVIRHDYENVEDFIVNCILWPILLLFSGIFYFGKLIKKYLNYLKSRDPYYKKSDIISK